MFQSRRERFLGTVVFFSLVIFIGMFIYRSFGEQWTLMYQGVDDRKAEIHTMLDIQEQSIEIKDRHEKMESELKVEGTNSEQSAAVRKYLVSILNQVGLNNKYDQVTPREPRKEDEFKVITYNINRIECTPQQLGQLLYRLEKDSKVIEVEKCVVHNLVTEVGKPASRRVGTLLASGKLTGLLEVDLQISRLVEYRKGEKPKPRGRS